MFSYRFRLDEKENEQSLRMVATEMFFSFFYIKKQFRDIIYR